MNKFALVVSLFAFCTLPAMAHECTVKDPTGTLLNVRYEPNGTIAQSVAKGERLYNGIYTPTIDAYLPLPVVKDSKGRDWQYVALSNPKDLDQENGGWVLASFIHCD